MIIIEVNIYSFLLNVYIVLSFYVIFFFDFNEVIANEDLCF